MNYYFVFGHVLSSELDLPDLPAVSAQDAKWNLSVFEEGPPECVRSAVGEHEVGGWWYRLFRTETGFRLVFANNYIFDIEDHGSLITWYSNEQAIAENVRALLLGPVLSIAQDLSGSICLHGSAVSVGRMGVAFIAAKFHGKSTLSLALTLAGAQLITDDSVAIDFDGSVQVRPGVHSVRLWQDSAENLGAAELDAVLVEGMKNTLTAISYGLLQREAVPLTAVYLLESVRPMPDTVAIERVRCTPGEAAIALSCHTKLPQPLVGVEMRAAQFRKAAAIARDVPVFKLRIVRDFARLQEAVEQILVWHRTPAHVAPSSALGPTRRQKAGGRAKSG